MKIEKIYYDDHGAFECSEDESWVSKDKILSNYNAGNFIIICVGIVIHEDEDSVILAQNYDKDYQNFGNPFRVIKRDIVKRTVICDV